MQNMEDRMSSSSGSPQTSPATPLTLPYVLQLLGIESIPGGNKAMEKFVMRSTSGLLAMNGEDWVRQNRGRLVDELKYIHQTFLGDEP